MSLLPVTGVMFCQGKVKHLLASYFVRVRVKHLLLIFVACDPGYVFVRERVKHLLLFIFVACDQRHVFIALQDCVKPECVDVSAYIMRKMNRSADPCVDFYSYSCGGWESTTFIPPEHAKYDTFAEVHTNNEVILKRVSFLGSCSFDWV